MKVRLSTGTGKCHLAVIALLCVSLFGCASYKQKKLEESKEYEPLELDYSLPATTRGGLFRQGYTNSILSDRRALRVGDILTVVLDESTQSSKSAGTSFGKKSANSLPAPTLFNSVIDDLNTSISSDRDFSGSAKSSQQNTLRGAIAVTVHKVLPNGTLLVKGEKALRLNQGDEYIRLTGLVRLDDINHRNQISSQHVANAKISYSGKGPLAQTNQAGWLTRFFASPLFPM
ncbi:MAG: flagellar basal body L-ring protein FlgH [Cellvibrio sp.]